MKMGGGILKSPKSEHGGEHLNDILTVGPSSGFNMLIVSAAAGEKCGGQTASSKLLKSQYFLPHATLCTAQPSLRKGKCRKC